MHRAVNSAQRKVKTMIYCSKTDIGKKRDKNEDTAVACRLAENALIIAVFDGMGGQAGGEIASSVAAEGFLSEIKYQCESRIRDGRLYFADPETEISMLLDSAAANANYQVWQRAQDDKSLSGMGTTLTGALVFEDERKAYTVNIGDSRIYKISSDGISQLTKDHSYVQYLVDIGEITEKEAQSRTDKNIITRALGISIRAEVDIKEEELLLGDSLLFCSDGLYDMISDNDISAVLRSDGTLDARAESLIELANEAGGEDNITVVVAEM
ncbi:MAG: Stp1/IreP family PP2C-type Ser/Thr phosphatase [Ruminococcaceae bacterium]|nr:Stp1/IreP family PP2C-type Ser/Thr phosphatase [Oscillospiraceae bacterium]